MLIVKAFPGSQGLKSSWSGWADTYFINILCLTSFRRINMKKTTFQTLLLVILFVKMAFDYFITDIYVRSVIFVAMAIISLIFIVCNETFKED